MKKLFLTLAILAALPSFAVAGLVTDGASKAAEKAAPKVHHMQNASGDVAVAPAAEAAPEHTMNNSNPSTEPAAKPSKEHHMMNK